MATVVKTIRIDPDIWEDVVKRAAENATTTNHFVVAALTLALGRRTVGPRSTSASPVHKIKDLQVGPKAPPAGSRLKSDVKPKARR
jgi:hypothetical protein